jgi:hypothetical protein
MMMMMMMMMMICKIRTSPKVGKFARRWRSVYNLG